MTDPTRLSLEGLLQVLYGSFARATIRTSGTCAACARPCPDYTYCYQCYSYGAERPDAAGFVTYAQEPDTAGRLMRAYKESNPPANAIGFVQVMLAHGLSHLSCADSIVGHPITHFSVVPTTRTDRPNPTPPLLEYVPKLMMSELQFLPLTHALGNKTRQHISQDLFVMSPIDAPNAHLLIIDDTWVSGGNMLSAVHAARAAGAAHVTSLVVARWLSSPPEKFMHAVNTPPRFNNASCPFAATPCLASPLTPGIN